MFGGIDSIRGNGLEDEGGKNTFYKAEFEARVQDLESKQTPNQELSSNNVPMAFLSSSATLADVISAVNELIKRDLTRSRVK